MPATDDQSRDREYTVHRLEAFSDIVIAFSLSQLAFTLPVSGTAGPPRTFQIVAFIGSFALVCAFWWLHHRLFARYFVPDVASIILNFAFLASTVLVVYSQQLLLRYPDWTNSRIPAGYALSFGCAYGLLAILYFKGLCDPRLDLDDAARSHGTARAIRLAIVAAVLLMSVVLALLGASQRVVVVAWLAIPVIMLVFRALGRSGPQGLTPSPSSAIKNRPGDPAGP